MSQTELFYTDSGSSAVFGGPNNIYRYVLRRKIFETDKETLLAIMVNPSTADAEKDDHTITKLLGFCYRWCYSRLVVVNLFAFRATDVGELKSSQVDVCGPDNDRHILEQATRANAILCAWGSREKLPKAYRSRANDVSRMLPRGVPVFCLGLTKDGDPIHPLTLAYETQRVPYPYTEE